MTAITRVRGYVLLAAAVPLLTIALRLEARQERDAGGFRAPTTALERGRAVYVLNHCHFCHGVDLSQATMGAANLSQSPFVGADKDGDMIGPLVKAGLPNLQTAMPSYSELTPEEIVDLARYIHFLRQQARFKELNRLADTPAGDRAAGEAYFNGEANCRSCHSVTGDLADIGRKDDLRRFARASSDQVPRCRAKAWARRRIRSRTSSCSKTTRRPTSGPRRVSRRGSVVQNGLPFRRAAGVVSRKVTEPLGDDPHTVEPVKIKNIHVAPAVVGGNTFISQSARAKAGRRTAMM